jgi:hypothetical protein
MRIHTNADMQAIYHAETVAGVQIDNLTPHGSRKSTRAFEVLLTGDSNRRPNGGSYGAGNSYAATWDQWGVFLAKIFEIDPDASCWAYENAADFHYKTSTRFAEGWPEDAHGDHTFRFQGVAGQQSCTKCSATKRW